jgi:secreted PhoX family phosphatase
VSPALNRQAVGCPAVLADQEKGNGMGKGFETADGVNTSDNAGLPSPDVSRRHWLSATAGAVVALLGSHALPLGAATSRRPLGFTAVPVSTADEVVVPPEYRADVLLRWGDPIGAAGGAPAFKPDASNSAAEQALQAGMHHDGMHFSPL